MTDHDIVLTTIPGAASPQAPSPSEEDWAVLTSGQASPWLRNQLMEVVLRDPEAADRLAELTDPGYRAAIAEAGELIRQPLPVPALMIVHGEGGAAVRREVGIRLRPSLLTLFCGVAAICGGYLMGGAFFAMSFAIGLVCLLLFAIDYLHTNPVFQARRARASGDLPLAEALEDQITVIRGQRASGE